MLLIRNNDQKHKVCGCKDHLSALKYYTENLDLPKESAARLKTIIRVWLLCYTFYMKDFKVSIRACESWETEHWYREWGAGGNLTMNSPWKNLQSVNQPAHRLQRASAGNTESVMLSVPLQTCNEISGQSDWIILMVFSRSVPRALTPLTDKARLWKKISLSEGCTNTIWRWSIYTGLWGVLHEWPHQRGSPDRINLEMCSFQLLFSIFLMDLFKKV